MKTLSVHSQYPESHRLKQALMILNQGGILIYPTDSGYALGCSLTQSKAIHRIRHIRQLSERHHLTLLCRDLSEISRYAGIENDVFPIIKRHIPGPFTFILPATREVPRYLRTSHRGTIGIRVSEHPIVQCLLEHHGQPLVNSSLICPNEEEALCDPEDIQKRLKAQVDCFIETGIVCESLTTLVDLTDSPVTILRQGQGQLT